MKNFFKDYLRRMLIGAAVLGISTVVIGVAYLAAWLVVGGKDNPLFYLIVYGVILILGPLVGALAKI